MTRETEFDRVVSLSDATKELVFRSFQVNLRALDAIVQSRRGGSSLRGFDEVSSQMRMWSKDLHTELQSLGESSLCAVELTSLLVKQERTRRLLSLAATESNDPGASEALARADERASVSREKLVRQWRKIRRSIEDVDQLGMMACVLSRSAMIEASAGSPEQREHLSIVSREFYKNSEEVVDIIKRLLKATAER